LKDYNFQIGDMILDDKRHITIVGLITDMWDDYENLKMLRIKWIRKDNGSEYDWDYGLEYLKAKIELYSMKHYPVKE